MTAVAILSLAIGIGPNTALFSIVNTLFLKPFPAKDPDQIVRMSIQKDDRYEPVSYPNYVDFRDQNTVLSGLATWDRRFVLLAAEGQREMLPLCIASENYFQVFGIEPAAGRLFVPSQDEDPAGQPPAVISYSLWQRRFGSDPRVIGKTVLANGRAHTIIGVAARGFRGLDFQMPIDVWISTGSFTASERAYFARRDKGFGEVMGRLRPGVTKEQAQVQLNAIAARLAEAYPATNKGRRVMLTSAAAEDSRRGIALSVVVMSLVSLVLLIACANVAGLLLAQAESRRKDTAIRMALGARRWRLIRQLLTESLLLSLAGAALGLLAAAWVLDLVPALNPLPIALDFGIQIDARVLAYTLALSFATALLFGLSPALRASKLDLTAELKGVETNLRAGSRFFNLRTVLVVTQIAVGQFLLAGAGLLLRSYFNTRQIDPGFDTNKNMLVAFVAPIPDDPRRAPHVNYEEVMQRIESLPGVKQVSFARVMPLSGIGGGSQVNVSKPEGVLPSGAQSMDVSFNMVGLNYSSTMGARILRGRDFERADQARGSKVALINETMARQFWPVPGGAPNALGQWLRFEGADYQVVGIVEDGKYNGLRESARPYLFLLVPANYQGAGTLLVETAGAPGSMANTVRQVLSRFETNLKIVSLKTLEQQLRLSYLVEETAAGFVGAIGLLGIFLASVGLYGVVSYSTDRRTREFGIRMAMGAQARDVRRLVLGQGVKLSLIGVPIGLAGALAGGRFMSGFLYGVSWADPLTFAVSALAVIAIALAASHFPARRASKLDPMVSLRSE